MGYSIYQRHYGVPLSYDLITFQILGHNLSNDTKSLNLIDLYLLSNSILESHNHLKDD